MTTTRWTATVLAGVLLSGTLSATTGTTGVAAAGPPVFTEAGRYDTGGASGTDTAAEIVAYEDGLLYVLVPSGIDVVDLSVPATPTVVRTLSLPRDPTSVAVSGGLVAASVPAAARQQPGRVLFFRGDRQVGDVVVGALPDMVTFTPDGRRLLVANEGEPNSYGRADSIDPEGSVSVVTTAPFRTPAALRRPSPAQPVETIRFTEFDAGGTRPLPPGVRISGPGASVAQDLEPEYVTVSPDGRTAWVTLQENNALARLDLQALRVAQLVPLEPTDHRLPGNALDASDRDGGINIRNWPVKGLPMPDGITDYQSAGQTFLVTANEGDAREYPGHVDVGRARAVAATATAVTEAASNADLGRLNVITTTPAPRDAAGRVTELFSFGTRSFSIRDASGALVWDSGDRLERLVAELRPANFNASNSNNRLDDRSDDKGPEPESVVVGEVAGRQLAFVALERIGGVVVYDVTDPRAPVYRQYLTTRDFSTSAVGPDSGPEGLVFVPGSDRPDGRALLVVGNEVTGTVNVWAAG